MQDYGVNLICVGDGIDSSKEAGKLLISIIAAVAEIDLRGIFEYIAFELQALEVSLIGLKHVLWILIICRRDIDNMNWNHGKVEGYA